MGAAKEMEQQYTLIFTFFTVSFPFTYLGIPIFVKMLAKTQWCHIDEKMQKKLVGWQENICQLVTMVHQ
jgi:hypothetical protein